MPTHLLTWNPSHWSWEDLKKVVRSVMTGVPHQQRWSCGNSRSIPIGARVFLLRQGVEPKGIMAAGWVTHPPVPEAHWDDQRAARGDQAHYIRFAVESVIDPEAGDPLDLRDSVDGPLSTFPLNAAASGNRITDEEASALEEAWSLRLGQNHPRLGFADSELGAFEGKRQWHLASHRGRERALREAKLACAKESSPDGRIRCEVPGCGFDFESVYGALGAGFAHVHHLRALGSAESATFTTLEDLAVVCANCHAMIHLGGECRDISTLIPRTEAGTPPGSL